MFCYILVFVTLFGVFSNVASDSVPPCKLSDPVCLDKLTVKAYPKYIEADPELKTESLDPMFHDRIYANFTVLQYEVFNSTVTGFRDCKMENVTLNANMQLHFDLECPKLVISGKYNVTGQLISLPVAGVGDYTVKTKTYLIAVDANLALVQGKDGKSHISVKDFKEIAEPLEPVTYDFRNLFDGQKDLADVALKFANVNWLAVSRMTQSPAFNKHFKKIFKNANKYFKTVPVEK